MGSALVPAPPMGGTQMVSSPGRGRERRVARGAIAAAFSAACVVGGGAYLLLRGAGPSSEDSEPPAATAAVRAPAAAPAPAPAAAAPAPARMTAAPLAESAPWPEREALPAATKRPEARPNTAPSASARREQLAQRANLGASAMDLRAGTALGAQRAPANRTSVAAIAADMDQARKTPAALPEHAGSAAGANPAAAADGILGRGQAAFDRGDYPEAVRRGREAITAGGALGGHLLVGDAYYRLERFPDALREYQAALALDPANASIKRRRDLAEQSTAR